MHCRDGERGRRVQKQARKTNTYGNVAKRIYIFPGHKQRAKAKFTMKNTKYVDIQQWDKKWKNIKHYCKGLSKSRYLRVSRYFGLFFSSLIHCCRSSKPSVCFPTSLPSTSSVALVSATQEAMSERQDRVQVTLITKRCL